MSMLCPELYSYVKTALGLPFFYVVGESEPEVKTQLIEAGFTIVRISDFCQSSDKYPNLDDVIDGFRTADVDYKDNKIAIIGLGKYLAFRGRDFALKAILRLKNITTGSARVVLLINSVGSLVKEAIGDDQRLVEQKRVFFSGEPDAPIRLTLLKTVKEKPNYVIKNGFKAILGSFEEGDINVIGTSDLLFENSLISISYLNTSYEILKSFYRDIKFPEDHGTDEEWGYLLDQMRIYGSLESVFEKNNIPTEFETNIYQLISIGGIAGWLFFLSLKSNEEKIQNSYLKAVLQKSKNCEELKNGILNYIVSIPPSSPRFRGLYFDRKKIVKDFPEGEIALFVQENNVDPTDSIYRYTDNTLLERRAILKWISQHNIPPEIENIYPDLQLYLNPYIFKGTTLDDELSSYFDLYKKAKLTCHIPEDLKQKVNEYATSYIYTHLKSRDGVINAIPNKDKTFLYWIDALGVEYLSYITALAKKKGLSINVEIARAELPTITGINRRFYDDWTGPKNKLDGLDQLKHNEIKNLYFDEDGSSSHLAHELEVISSALDFAMTQLAAHKCSKFVIASDHGASRLAVLDIQENKYETDTGGEHSGRCCKSFEGCDIKNCVQENGYIALTDYGRFKGSRAARVEAHGGATLEEVVVPIITLSLKTQTVVDIRVFHPDNIYADRNKGTEIVLYISDVSNKTNVSIVIGQKAYRGEKWIYDAQHYQFQLTDIKKARKCCATVFDGDDQIGSVEFVIKSQIGSVNSDFDDLF